MQIALTNGWQELGIGAAVVGTFFTAVGGVAAAFAAKASLRTGREAAETARQAAEALALATKPIINLQREGAEIGSTTVAPRQPPG